MHNSHRRVAVALAAALAATFSLLLAPPASAAAASSSITLTSVKATQPGTLVTGAKVTLKGSASKSLVGRRLVVQRYTGKTWVAVTGSPKVTTARTFAITVKSGGVGSVKYRVIYKGSSSIRAAVSNSKAITTYRWLYLSRMEAKSARNAYDAAVEINGVNYSNSVVLYNVYDGHTSYNVKRQCTKFVMAAGVPDDEDITERAPIDILHDGTVVYSAHLDAGHTYAISQDITDILELRIEHNPSGDAYGELGLGNARVLCRF